MNEQFYQWLGKRISEYEVARERGLQAYRTRVSRVAEERNDGVAPNESSAGIHAPFDGYVYTWAKGNDVFENTFLKGQFLPWPSDYEDYSIGSFTEQTRIEYVPLDRAKLFVDGYKSLPVGQRKTVHIYHGQSFTDRDSGKEICHVYVSKCPVDLCAAIRDYLRGDLDKLQHLAQQKTEDEKSARDKAHSEGEDVTEGRQLITGMILAFKWQDSHYGSVKKMLVQDDRGCRLWGSVPSGLDAMREDQISFTATVERSDRDSKFGFFKRPAKASVN